jgi:hypothetical protein
MWSDDKQEQKHHGREGEDWLRSPDGSSAPALQAMMFAEILKISGGLGGV